MLRFARSCGFALFLAVSMAAPVAASHSWSGYHWARTTASFDLPVVDSVTADWQATFDEALARWGQSTKFDNVVAGAVDDSRTRKRCPMVAGGLRVCNAAYGQNGWLGLASINVDGNGHITQGTTKVNDSYGWYFAQTPGEDHHVMCQEIGHTYGLAHTSEDGTSQDTCMDYSSSLTSQWPNAHDYEELDLIYGHLDAYDSYSTGTGGGGGGCTAPPGRGCNKLGAPDDVPPGAALLHYHAGRGGHTGHAEYALADGDGGTWVFHLTLLPEDARRR